MRKRNLLFVDGYNMIGSWPSLMPYQQDNMQIARDLLLEELANYGSYRAIDIIVVFDAQFVPGLTTSFDKYAVQVVFTANGETADTYIEREVQHYIHPRNRVTVATSDMAEQWVIFQRGALRQSANELWIDIQHTKQVIYQEVKQYYNMKIRRHSPWAMEQLAQLDELRRMLD